MKCRSWKQKIWFMLPVSFSNRCQSWIYFAKKSSKHLNFYLNLPNISNDKKFSKHFYAGFFLKWYFISLIWENLSRNSIWIKLSLYLKNVFSQFLLHLLSSNLILFKQKLLENWILDAKMHNFNEHSIIRSRINTLNLFLKISKRFS